MRKNVSGEDNGGSGVESEKGRGRLSKHSGREWHYLTWVRKGRNRGNNGLELFHRHWFAE